MKLVLDGLPQMLVMSCVVATMMLVPILAAAGLAAYFGFGIAFADLVTFGESLNGFEGVVAWWLIVLVPAIAYSATVMPWYGRE